MMGDIGTRLQSCMRNHYTYEHNNIQWSYQRRQKGRALQMPLDMQQGLAHLGRAGTWAPATPSWKWFGCQVILHRSEAIYWWRCAVGLPISYCPPATRGTRSWAEQAY